MINSQLINLKSKLWLVLSMVVKQWSRIIGCGYLLACLWLSANTAFAVHSLRVTVPQPLAVAQEPSASSYPSNRIIDLPVTMEDVSLLRDPFSDHPALDASPAAKTASLATSGLLLQGIILSRKSGIVLQDPQSGTVYFLSEGEEIGGVRAKNITKTNVSVDMNGKLMDFSILGVKK
jgi:type II secretory pathway component PulC